MVKFKTKEDFKINETINTTTRYANEIVDKVFESFSERVKFFDKYRGKSIYFGNKNVKLYAGFEKWHNNTFACFPNYRHTHEGEMYREMVFNRWLFEYCFGDMIE